MQAERTLEWASQDLGNDNSKFKEPDSLLTRSQRLHHQMIKKTTALEPLSKALTKRGNIVQELRLEATKLDGNDEPEGIPLNLLYQECPVGKGVSNTLQAWQGVKSQRDAAEAAHAFNSKSAPWPDRLQPHFVQRINTGRQAVGLSSLLAQCRM